MKTKLLVLGLLMLLSCINNDKKKKNSDADVNTEIQIPSNETFNTIDNAVIKALNNTIQSNSLKSPDEIMRSYKPESKNVEGNYSYTIHHEDLDSKSKKVTLIEKGLPDDSVYAIQTIMTIKDDNGLLKVTNIKENYKCWDNRGYNNWSAEKCQ